MKWFIQTYVAPRARPVAVLDVGSFDISGIGTYGDLFKEAGIEAACTGLDLAPGPNVDVVAARPYHWDMLPDETPLPDTRIWRHCTPRRIWCRPGSAEYGMAATIPYWLQKNRWAGRA